ncbi:hypothetical protein N431DRAFT_505122 [Stipitochalara longipes BDJ]|nr:hypothetical protein N431DRAFT_505122 [Stipitochalara longipes BDJ]
MLIGFTVKGIASGIGLISESVHAHKEAKLRKKERESATRTNSGDPSFMPDSSVETQVENHESEASTGNPNGPEPPRDLDHLEEEWELDDAQDDILPPYATSPPSADRSGANGAPSTALEITDRFLIGMPSHQHTSNLQTQLPCPVVLPQRRPKDRSRGFIRAYAPVLEPCGISQAEWLAFLDTFQKASEANPWIQAINLASFATSAVPMPGLIAMAISTAISVVANVATEFHGRYKQNQFLDKINDEWFRPRGLFCLLMTWNPESDRSIESVDVTSTITSQITSKHKFQASSGQSHGEMTFPAVAPLIFPALDHLNAQTDEASVKKREKLKKAGAFLADYSDRRATATFAAQNPNSILATSVPAPQFHSQYADPASQAASGDLISLITHGKFSADRGGGAMRGRRGMRGGQLNGRGGIGRGIGGGGGLLDNSEGLGNLKILKKNVLYLMVVNMPSDDEIAAAMQKVRQ